jgi:hypothetical protein
VIEEAKRKKSAELGDVHHDPPLSSCIQIKLAKIG